MARSLRDILRELQATVLIIEEENVKLKAENAKLATQFDDALDGIAELKDRVRQLQQMNEELRGLPVPRAVSP